MEYPEIEVIVPGEPPTKARPRFTGKGYSGRAYTPANTRRAEELFGWAVRAVAPGLTADVTGQYRIVARFYQGSFQRRDLDNMIKLVSDACNGLIWVDDSQVIAIDAELERGASEPRSHVIFQLVANAEIRPMAKCAACGKEFRLYPSHVEKSRACSAACAAHLRSGVDLSVEVACSQCGGMFTRRTTSQHLCSSTCRIEWMRDRNQSAALPNHCSECGAVTANPRAQRCRACWRKSLTPGLASV